MNSITKIVLAIETSCDETAVAVIKREKFIIEVLASEVASQIDVHKETGGVVPEVAAREHVVVMQPMLSKVLRDSGVAVDKIGGIAVTTGPGLMPALSVGVNAARALAMGWDLPVISVNHLEGHITSALLSNDEEILNQKFEIRNKFTNTKYEIPKRDKLFPVVGLIVSGGHTLLVRMEDWENFEILGSTRDDAAGEAFDKVARLLGLGYPGGPEISKAAQGADSENFIFTRPMLNSGDLDFSFSGLKTEVLYKVREMSEDDLNKNRGNLAASFQAAAIESLVRKTRSAIRKVKPKTAALSGGVAANLLLREEMREMAKSEEVELKIAPLDLCGDNAVMIGMAALLGGKKSQGWEDIEGKARFSLNSLV